MIRDFGQLIRSLRFILIAYGVQFSVKIRVHTIFSYAENFLYEPYHMNHDMVDLWLTKNIWFSDRQIYEKSFALRSSFSIPTVRVEAPTVRAPLRYEMAVYSTMCTAMKVIDT